MPSRRHNDRVTTPASIPSLDEIEGLRDAAARGRALERFVANLFRKRHFTVIVNSRTARPRQTDLLAVKLAERYLVECKWQNRPATINDLDSLRSRLHRTSPDTAGLLVSMNGFTEEVRTDVRYQRQQPVLLLSGNELRDIEAGFRHSLTALLFLKKEGLLRDARVLLDEPRSNHRRARRLPYPQPKGRFVSPDGAESLVCASGGEFGRFTFTQELSDIDWTSSGGFGVTLDIPLDIGDEDELINAIHTLVDLGWTTEQGRWCSQQRDRNWHGVGVAALISHLPQWRERTGHHSEEIVYIDRCDNGFYSITANLTADLRRHALDVQLSFQLEGLPLDSAPLLHLCRGLGAHDNLRVRPRAAKSRNLLHLRDNAIDLTVRGFIVANDPYAVETDGQWTTGIITDNPYRASSGRRHTQLPDGLELLAGSEVLLCDLRQHHLLREPRTGYYLDAIEWAWTSDAVACRPIADWPSPEHGEDFDDQPPRTPEPRIKS